MVSFICGMTLRLSLCEGMCLGFMCGGQFSFRISVVEMDPRYDSLDVLSLELIYLHGLGGTNRFEHGN